MLSNLSRRAFMGTAVTAAAAGIAPRLAFAKGPMAATDAVAQAAALRAGEITPLELVDAAIARIQSVNPKVNAVVAEFFDKARAQAKQNLSQGPLSGVPYLIKDLDDVKGEIATSGSRLMAKHVGQDNAPMAAKAIDSGMIVLGKTNTPEFGLTATTESLLLGACHNPWNLEHSTGGSSGGAAAAVASGMLPVAHASDGGGSIRIPASCCGVFGLKPSRGRMNLGGSKMPGDIGVENCVSRTVRDSATMFAISEDTAANAVFKPTGFVSGPSKTRLKVAFATRANTGAEPDPEVKASIEATAKLCESMGHHVVEDMPPVNGEEFIECFITAWAAGAASLVQLAQSLKLKPEDVLEPWTLGLAEYFMKKPSGTLEKSLANFKTVEAQMETFFAKHDVWLTPVLAAPPPKIGWLSITLPFETHFKRVTEYVAYTPLHNAAGTPAMSVPLGWSKSGLPIGSHFAAAKGNERMLYELAYELEAAQPWANRHASTFAG